MNLLTYTSPCSVSPRRMSLSLYKDTLSRELFMKKGSGVLQLLTKKHMDLFQLLGKTSGRQVDKIQNVQEMGCRIKEWCSESVLDDAASFLALEAASDYIPCGDHDVVICNVTSCDNQLDEGRADEILYTADLRARGLII